MNASKCAKASAAFRAKRQQEGRAIGPVARVTSESLRRLDEMLAAKAGKQ